MDRTVIRRAQDGDADTAAGVWLRSYDTALPTVRRAHTDDEVRRYFRDVVLPERETWVASEGDQVVAVMVLQDDWVTALYIDPPWRGRGIGDRLIDLAKQRCPGGLQLWTFQVNGPAQRFYLRHGFVEVERTDGSGNEEQEPDIRYVWCP